MSDRATRRPTGVAALPAGTSVLVDGVPGYRIVLPANGTRSMVVENGVGGRANRRIVSVDRVAEISR